MTFRFAGEADVIRVLLVDDHVLFRGAVECLLREEPGIEVCAGVADGAKAVELAASLDPDVVLMDVAMPVMDGVTAAGVLRELGLACRVIFLTAHRRSVTARAMTETGAVRLLVKGCPAEELVEAIRTSAGRSAPSGG